MMTSIMNFAAELFKASLEINIFLEKAAEYENIISEDVNKQKEITALYMELFKTRSTR
jgi:hypothetical protein